MVNKLSNKHQRAIFIFGITTIYILLIVYLDFLQGPLWGDERHFWAASLVFSDSLIPSIEDLKNYDALNTPLPFIVFGLFQYLFQDGILLGRLFNLFLSLVMVLIIGWPDRGDKGRKLLCAIGLLLYPYFLPLSGYIYTDTIASFTGLIGLIFYLNDRLILSCLAFILAIASRQYMLAFPMAIVIYEFISAMGQLVTTRKFDAKVHQRWFIPFLAATSVLGWFILFQGLAPEVALGNRAPEIQHIIWTLQPGAASNFLAIVGFYLIIPELILFGPSKKFRDLKKPKIKVFLIAGVLLLWFIVFPPFLGAEASGQVVKIANFFNIPFLGFSIYYGLSLLTCLRFAQLNLMTLMIATNGLIMMKAFPGGDKYLFPLAVVFWYLKSVNLEDSLPLFKQKNKKYV